MNIKTKKTTIVLVAVLAISLVAGNVLFAANDSFNGRERASDLIGAADIEMLSSGRSANTSPGSEVSNQERGGVLVSAKDVEFVSQPFSRDRAHTQTVYSSNDREAAPGLVSAADVRFVNGDVYGSNLLCVVDGVQVSGKRCVN